MKCEFLGCCRFFNDKMKNMPKSAEYIMNKVCLDNYESCARFKVFKELGADNIPLSLYPDDKEVQQVLHCLRNRQVTDAQ